MTAIKAGAPSACQLWNNINVDDMQQQVTRLQMRIAKAVKEAYHFHCRFSFTTEL